MVVVIGLLAAMAIPAFEKVRTTAIAKACANNERMVSAVVDQFTVEHGVPPANYADFVGSGKLLATMPTCPSGGTYSIKIDAQGKAVIVCSVHGNLLAGPAGELHPAAAPQTLP